MTSLVTSIPGTSSNVPFRPWNLGKLIGKKPPLKLREIWAIRIRLQIQERPRDLAMFNLAIDSKLRGCDLVALRVDDVLLSGRVRPRTTVIQRKSGRPVQFEITEQTREPVMQMDRQGRSPTRRLPVPEPDREEQAPDDPALRPADGWLGHLDRSGSAALRNPFAPANQGGPDLPAHRQSTGGLAPARPH